MPDRPTSLRYVPSPDELAYQRLLVVIEATRQQATALRVEIETLRDAVGRFEQTYHARTGHLLVELNRLRLACDEYRHRIAARRAVRPPTPDTVEGDVERLFRSRRQTVADEAEEAAGYRRLAEDGPAELDAADADELRRTYRDLARRNHPDLTTDPAERARREARMARINDAYRERDLEALRTLLALSPTDDEPGGQGRTAADRLAWATGELARLDGVVAALRQDLALTQEAPGHALWLRALRDPDLLEDLAAQVTGQIAEAQTRLTELEARYRTLLDDPIS